MVGTRQDLVAREEAFKRAKQDQAARAHANQAEASVQDQGKRMREAAAAAQLAAQEFARMEVKRAHTESLNARAKSEEKAASSASSDGSIPDLQRTLRLSLPLPQSAAIATSTDSLAAHLLPTYGRISDCVILPPKPAKKKSKGGDLKEQASAMVVFGKDNLGGCWALWEDCRTGRRGVEGWRAKWAEGGVEPEWVARLGRGQQQATLSQPAAAPASSPSSAVPTAPAPAFSFDPSVPPPPSAESTIPSPPMFSAPGPSEADYESATLLRMRQAERERLEREIREADEMED
jgi:DnaJ family protein C protein 17